MAGPKADLPEIETFRQHINAAFGAMGTNLDNIVADEQSLNSQLKEFRDNASLSANDAGKLNAIIAQSDTFVARTKEIADSVPDVTVTVPVISNINPSTLLAGAPDTLVVIRGTGMAGSQGFANDTALMTPNVDDAIVSVIVPGSLMASPGVIAITVRAGTVTSNSVPLTIG